MPDDTDPAIREAQTLWQQKKPREALLVLVRRIHELNLLLEGGPPTVPEPAEDLTEGATPSRTVPGRVVLLALVIVVGIAAAMIYLDNQRQERRIQRGAERVSTSHQLQRLCITWFTTVPRDTCNAWASRVTDGEEYDQVHDCTTQYEEYDQAASLVACLERQGIELPGPG